MNKYLAISILCGMLFLRCGFAPLAGGSTDTELGSVVTGRVVAENGSPVRDAKIRVRPTWYVQKPGTVINNGRFDAVTDSTGRFSVSGVYPGRYAIEANDQEYTAALIKATVEEQNSTIDVGVVGLKPFARIFGIIQPAITRVYPLLRVQVRGLERLATVGRDGTFAIVDLPEGSFDLRLVSTDSTVDAVEMSGISVKSAATESVVIPAGGRYARRLSLNTTASGADVAGDVADFPLLVRLTAGNFDFTQAKSNGADIRFAKSDGSRLPYQIERWDAVTGLAEVWVKMDTVYGGDSSQTLMMCWGNAAAVDSSDGGAVFDTAQGFQGIWHMGETDSLAPDATGNRYTGTGHFTSSVAGMIGNAQHFNGLSSYIQMKGTAPQSRLNFPMNGRYTVSAWVYHDTLADSATYLIAGKGEHQYFMKTFDLALSTPQRKHQWEFTEYHGNDLWQATTLSPATAKNWIHMVGVRDGANQYFYVNGTLAMEGYQVIGTGGSVTPRDSSDDFSIGAFLHPVSAWNQGYAYFSGAIDEVGVSSIPRNADWIKLSYMNQRAEDKLVVFNK